MAFSADELAVRLLNRPITDARVRKLKRFVRDENQRDALIEAINNHEKGGPDAAERIRAGLKSLVGR